ncbi:MAG: S9 family peptidase [Kangiella sp.]|nr:MAG: S9 family peptidase [Kangiella sp.]
MLKIIKSSLIVLLIVGFTQNILNAKELPVEVFANLPETVDADLSPDGTKLAMWVNLPSGEEMLISQDFKTGKITPILEAKGSGKKIYWFRWVNNNQVLVSVRFYSQYFSKVVANTRLLVVDYDGKNLKSIFTKSDFSRVDYMPNIQDNIVDWLEVDPEHILIEIRNRSVDPAVMKVNVKTLRKTEYKAAKGLTRNWISDQQNRVRVGRWSKTDEDKVTVKINVLNVKDNNWFTAWEFETFSEEVVTPLGFGSDPNILYIRAYHDNKLAIFKVDLLSKKLDRTLVYSHPLYDIDASLIFQRGKIDPIGINFAIDGETVIWDIEENKLRKKLAKALGGQSVSIISYSEDNNRYILYADDISSPGMYFLGDKKAKTLSPIAERYPSLRDVSIPKKEVVSYKARDGLDIEAFLLLPSKGGKKNLPTIIFPHGGPFASDDYSFDYWSAFFSNRGYAVLQMNFRGSSGYGFDFLNEGIGNWGLTMQNDIVDGTNWLIDEGVADADRVCIVGASYGGYAALLGAAKSSELFKCAISYAGVTDLLDLYKSSYNRKLTKRVIGSTRKQMKDNSPRYLAEKMDIPLLIVHADMDSRVSINQARNLISALKSEDKDFIYIEQEGGDHFLSDQKYRVEFFKAMDSFLSRHLN